MQDSFGSIYSTLLNKYDTLYLGMLLSLCRKSSTVMGYGAGDAGLSLIMNIFHGRGKNRFPGKMQQLFWPFSLKLVNQYSYRILFAILRQAHLGHWKPINLNIEMYLKLAEYFSFFFSWSSLWTFGSSPKVCACFLLRLLGYWLKQANYACAKLSMSLWSSKLELWLSSK